MSITRGLVTKTKWNKAKLSTVESDVVIKKNDIDLLTYKDSS